MNISTYGLSSPIVIGDGNTVNIFAPGTDGALLFEISSGLVEIELCGGDSLLAATIGEIVAAQNASLNECVVFVKGLDIALGKDAVFAGQSITGKIDGYVRTLNFNAYDSDVEISVGGSNATLERVASRSIKFVITDELAKALTDSVAGYYQKGVKELLTTDNMSLLFRARQYSALVAVAKILLNKPALDALLSVLNKPIPDVVFSHCVEAIRSFESLCARDVECATRATLGLVRFIKSRLKNKEFGLHIVYAVEALGYVSNFHRSTASIAGHCIREIFVADSALSDNRDLLWVALVTRNRLYMRHSSSVPTLPGHINAHSVSEHPYGTAIAPLLY